MTAVNSAARRRQVARACKKHGLMIQPAAMAELLSMEQQQHRHQESSGVAAAAADRTDDLLRLISATLSQHGSTTQKLITVPLLQGAMQQLLRGGDDDDDEYKYDTMEVAVSRTAAPSTTTNAAIIAPSTAHSRNTVISAFDMPRLVYDAMRQQFRYDHHLNTTTTASSSSSKAALLGTAEDLIEMRTQRYDLVRQRVVRHLQRHQLPPLMTIDRLLGSNAAAASSSSARMDDGDDEQQQYHLHVLLGLLRSNSSSVTTTGCCLELEDLTGTIPLQFSFRKADSRSSSSTKVDSDGIYMDGSIVLVKGNYLEDGTFLCREMTFPPLEKAKDTGEFLPPSPYAAGVSDMPLQQLGGKRSAVTTTQKTTIYCMGGLKLDDPDCVDELKRVIHKMKTSSDEINHDDDEKEGGDSQDGSILVLFGDFKTDTMKLSSAMEEIARILKASDLPRKHSVLIVPGTQDVAPNSCWPLPALDRRFTPLSMREMENVRMCTNPCRLELGSGQSILLIRKDLVRESVQNQILTVTKDMSINNAAPPPMDRRVLHHMLSQGHIMPTSTVHPIYWNFDHAMRLTPLPDLVIVGMDPDHTEDGLEFVRAGCRMLVPPSRDNFDNLLKVTIISNNDSYNSSTNNDVEVTMGNDEDLNDEDE